MVRFCPFLSVSRKRDLWTLTTETDRRMVRFMSTAQQTRSNDAPAREGIRQYIFSEMVGEPDEDLLEQVIDDVMFFIDDRIEDRLT